jgi:hypothetical protein
LQLAALLQPAREFALQTCALSFETCKLCLQDFALLLACVDLGLQRL